MIMGPAYRQLFLITFVFFINHTLGADESGPVVQTRYGSVQGKLMYAADSTKPVNTFYNIPFAAPPVGQYRFMKPQPLQPWTGTRDGTKPGNSCMQAFDDYLDSIFEELGYPPPDRTVSEDCLILNVHTTSTSTKQPVLVWIHGGGFFMGSGAFYDATAFASLTDVVVVTINYRVGILGFLGTMDENAPGNSGMWDQVAALKWVQENIAAFGGDPNQMTIAGESAGGFSVTYLMGTPVTKGLFQRAIPQSGSAVDSIDLSPVNAINNAKFVAKEMDCELPSLKEMVECLKKAKSEDFVSILTKIPQNIYWSPVIDGEFLPDSYANLYRQRKIHNVDLMVGFNTDEGYAGMPFLFPNNTGLENKENITKQIHMTLTDYLHRENAEELAKEIADFYLGPDDNQLDHETQIRQFINYYGEFLLAYPTLRTAHLHKAELGGRTYMYVFKHRMSFSTKPDWVLADHGDDLPFTFGLPFLDVKGAKKFNEEDRKTSTLLMTAINNFVRNGNPNGDGFPFWPEYSVENGEYMEMNNQPKVSKNYRKESMDFLKKTLHSGSVKSESARDEL